MRNFVRRRRTEELVKDVHRHLHVAVGHARRHERGGADGVGLDAHLGERCELIDGLLGLALPAELLDAPRHLGARLGFGRLVLERRAWQLRRGRGLRGHGDGCGWWPWRLEAAETGACGTHKLSQ